MGWWKDLLLIFKSASFHHLIKKLRNIRFIQMFFSFFIVHTQSLQKYEKMLQL
jgi:hypothetical protein